MRSSSSTNVQGEQDFATAMHEAILIFSARISGNKNNTTTNKTYDTVGSTNFANVIYCSYVMYTCVRACVPAFLGMMPMNSLVDRMKQL